MPGFRKPRRSSPRFVAGRLDSLRIASGSVMHLLLPDVLAEHAREVPVGARVRHGLQEDALGRLRARVRSEGDPRQRDLLLHVVLGHQEEDRADPDLRLDEQVERGVDPVLAAHLRDVRRASCPSAASSSPARTPRAGRGRASRSAGRGSPSPSPARASAPAIFARVSGSWRRLSSFSSPPSCAHGGTQASSDVAPAVYVYMFARDLQALAAARPRPWRSPGPSSASSACRPAFRW